MATVNGGAITDLAIPELQSAVLIGVMILYGSLVFCGVIFVTVFVLVLIRGRQTFKEIPFFIIVWQLTICNFIGIYIQAFCKFPLLFIDTNDETSLQYSFEVVGTRTIYFTDTGFTLFVLLMALNRFAVFVFPNILFLFSRCNIWYSIGFTWLLVICITIVKILWGGVETFDKNNLSITELLVKADSNIFIRMVTLLDYFVSVILLLIYLMIYISLQKKRAAHGIEDKDDKSLLTQAVVVAVSLIVFRTLANISVAIQSTWLSWLVNILRFSASVCNNMLNPSNLFYLSPRKIQYYF